MAVNVFKTLMLLTAMALSGKAFDTHMKFPSIFCREFPVSWKY